MSGLFGIYNRDNSPLNPDSVRKMGISIKHRGPDGMHVWQDGPVGIGHCIMHTTTEFLNEHLPYFDIKTGLVITADARLDNRDELVSRLGLEKELKNTIPDSQLILIAYQKWNVDCVRYFLGDFAFVIWDSNCKQLFCARDQLGIKPFYYYLSQQIFVFASETRAVLTVSQVPHKINQGRIADFLITQLEGIDKKSTFYEEVFRLPPAHTMLLSDKHVHVSNYWQLDPEYETRFKTDGEYIEAFSELLTDATRARLRCSDSPASMLSGGIDSSAVTGIAQQLMQDTSAGSLLVFSGISKTDDQCLETHFINTVIKHTGVNSFTADTSNLKNYDEELLSVFKLLEEPFDSDMTLIILVYLMAHRSGCRVMLDGVEGDIVHSLSTSYPAYLFRRGQFILALSESRGLWKNNYQKETPFLKLLYRTVRSALVTNTIYKHQRKIFSNIYLKRELTGTYINQEFADRVDIKDRLEQLAAHGSRGLCSTLREQHIRNVMHPYLTVALERYDRIAALCSVEPRHPLLDRKLVEFSVSLPWDQLVRNGWSKYLLRRTCASFLPGEVAWRRGWEHIGWSITSAFQHTHLQQIRQEIALQEPLIRPYVDSTYLGRILHKAYTLNTYEDESMHWKIYQLANWLSRQQITKQEAEELAAQAV